MDRDNFIIAVFLLGCEQYCVIRQQYRLRRGGFEPALTDEEVITMEICGEYFKLEYDNDFFAYFHMHYLHFFEKFTLLNNNPLDSSTIISIQLIHFHFLFVSSLEPDETIVFQ